MYVCTQLRAENSVTSRTKLFVATILKASTRNNVSVDREYDGAWRSPSGDMPKPVSSLYHHVSCHPERIWVGGRLVSSAV